MKVKIFEAAVGHLLEEQINKWLADNEDIEIERVLQSETGDASPNITISIWYQR